VISSDTPPGTSSHSTAWSRHAAWFFCPAQVPVPPGPHPQRCRVIIGDHRAPVLERSAATATDKASFGSFFARRAAWLA
jgi:hypothetical protein